MREQQSNSKVTFRVTSCQYLFVEKVTLLSYLTGKERNITTPILRVRNVDSSILKKNCCKLKLCRDHNDLMNAKKSQNYQ